MTNFLEGCIISFSFFHALDLLHGESENVFARNSNKLHLEYFVFPSVTFG